MSGGGIAFCCRSSSDKAEDADWDDTVILTGDQQDVIEAAGGIVERSTPQGVLLPFASLDKRWAFFVRRRPWKRLMSAIISYERDVRARAASHKNLSAGLDPICEVLLAARCAGANGDVELGWKCLLTAQRIEIFYLEPAELDAVVIMIRREAEKLNPWRKRKYSCHIDGADEWRIYRSKKIMRAAAIRDEHYHNEAYKDGLRRSSALCLAFLLILSLVALFEIGQAGWFADFASSPNLAASPDRSLWGRVLLTIGTLGLLGAIVSAITDMPKTHASARIPEMASSLRVIILRLFIGPVSSIVLYFAIRSAVFENLINFGKDGFAIFVLAFASGFSERLVLRVVERIAATQNNGREGSASA